MSIEAAHHSQFIVQTQAPNALHPHAVCLANRRQNREWAKKPVKLFKLMRLTYEFLTLIVGDMNHTSPER